MKNKLMLCLNSLLVLIVFAGCGKKAADPGITKEYLVNDERRESYVLGHDLAGIMMSSGDHQNQFSHSFFFKGFDDRLTGMIDKKTTNEIRYAFEDPDSTAANILNIKIEGINGTKDKQSYLLGVYHADMITNNPESFNYTCFKKGFEDMLDGLPPLLNDNSMEMVRNASRKKIEELHRNADMSVSAEEKVKLNRKYLIDNSKRESVKTLQSGLQYAVISEGKGEKINVTDKIKVEYRGTFIDGREFDSSYKKGIPAVFTLEDDIIEGWKQGISLMRVGARYKFFMPPELAYGKDGMKEIPPNSTLIYDIEILGIINDNDKVK